MKLKELWKEIIVNTNWDGVSCVMKGNLTIEEMKNAVDMQRMIDNRN